MGLLCLQTFFDNPIADCALLTVIIHSDLYFTIRKSQLICIEDRIIFLFQSTLVAFSR